VKKILFPFPKSAQIMLTSGLDDGSDMVDITQEDIVFSGGEISTPYISIKMQIHRLKYPCDKMLV
jgi:hypothetical protein